MLNYKNIFVFLYKKFESDSKGGLHCFAPKYPVHIYSVNELIISCVIYNYKHSKSIFQNVSYVNILLLTVISR